MESLICQNSNKECRNKADYILFKYCNGTYLRCSSCIGDFQTSNIKNFTIKIDSILNSQELYFDNWPPGVSKQLVMDQISELNKFNTQLSLTMKRQMEQFFQGLIIDFAQSINIIMENKINELTQLAQHSREQIVKYYEDYSEIHQLRSYLEEKNVEKLNELIEKKLKCKSYEFLIQLIEKHTLSLSMLRLQELEQKKEQLLQNIQELYQKEDLIAIAEVNNNHVEHQQEDKSMQFRDISFIEENKDATFILEKTLIKDLPQLPISNPIPSCFFCYQSQNRIKLISQLFRYVEEEEVLIENIREADKIKEKEDSIIQVSNLSQSSAPSFILENSFSHNNNNNNYAQDIEKSFFMAQNNNNNNNNNNNQHYNINPFYVNKDLSLSQNLEDFFKSFITRKSFELVPSFYFISTQDFNKHQILSNSNIISIKPTTQRFQWSHSLNYLDREQIYKIAINIKHQSPEGFTYIGLIEMEENASFIDLLSSQKGVINVDQTKAQLKTGFFIDYSQSKTNEYNILFCISKGFLVLTDQMQQPLQLRNHTFKQNSNYCLAIGTNNMNQSNQHSIEIESVRCLLAQF